MNIVTKEPYCKRFHKELTILTPCKKFIEKMEPESWMIQLLIFTVASFGAFILFTIFELVTKGFTLLAQSFLLVGLLCLFISILLWYDDVLFNNNKLHTTD